MKKLITAQEFEEAFRSQWEEDRCSREYGEKIKVLISDPYWDDDNEAWKKFMVEADKPFFFRVLQKLKREGMNFCREFKVLDEEGKPLSPELKRKYKKLSKKYYKFDCVYQHCESVNKYPPWMEVLIECENNYETTEYEMWKLLRFRSPLKVLVTYDWSERAKRNPHRVNALKKKLDELEALAREIDGSCKEVEEMEYLIVTGHQGCDDAIWKFKKLTMVN